MTAKIINFLFFIYQGLFASRAAACRYTPTCSEYARRAIGTYGLFKGSYLTAKRLISCHPFSSKPTYDPVGPKTPNLGRNPKPRVWGKTLEVLR